jgi:hypothetical protein
MRKMAIQVWSDELMQVLYTGGITTTLTTALLGLFQAPVALSPSVLKADLDAAEATYVAYAKIALGATPGVYLDPLIGWIVPFPALLFTYTSAPANLIYGWYLVNAANTLLFGAGNFAVPRNMAVAGDGLLVQLQFQIGYPPPLELILNGQPQ